MTETTVTIDNREGFLLGAIERSKEIVNQEATALALAVRDDDDEAINQLATLLERQSPKRCLKSSMVS